jgi:hypothetical protein
MKKASSFFSKTLAFASLLSLSAPFAQAAKFSNQFTEFELPPGWTCNLEAAEWVCQNLDPAKSKEAIIVLAAKLKGDQDSLDQYLSYLKATKTFTSVSGKPMKSEPRFSSTKNLNGHPWVDALHLESEIPGFYTRYFATVKDDIAVLVTYSVAKAKYQEYQKAFDPMIATLKVFRKSGGINVAPANTNILQPNIPTTIADGTVFPGVNPQGGALDPERGSQSRGQARAGGSKGSDDLMFYGLIVLGAAVFFIIRKKKRG